MGFGLPNQEETHRREFESPPGYHTPRSEMLAPCFSGRGHWRAQVIPEPKELQTQEIRGSAKQVSESRMHRRA